MRDQFQLRMTTNHYILFLCYKNLFHEKSETHRYQNIGTCSRTTLRLRTKNRTYIFLTLGPSMCSNIKENKLLKILNLCVSKNHEHLTLLLYKTNRMVTVQYLDSWFQKLGYCWVLQNQAWAGQGLSFGNKLENGSKYRERAVQFHIMDNLRRSICNWNNVWLNYDLRFECKSLSNISF